MPERPFQFWLWSPEGEAAEKLCKLAGFYYGAHRGHRQTSWRIPPKKTKKGKPLWSTLPLHWGLSTSFKWNSYVINREASSVVRGSLMWPFPANHLSFYPWLYFNSSYPSPFWGRESILWKEILTLIINFPSMYVLSAMAPPTHLSSHLSHLSSINSPITLHLSVLN